MTYKPEVRVGIDWDGDGFLQMGGVSSDAPASLLDDIITPHRWTRARNARWEDVLAVESIEDDSKGIVQVVAPLGDTRADGEATCVILFDKETKQHTPFVTPLFDGNDLTNVEVHRGLLFQNDEVTDYGNEFIEDSESGASNALASIVIGKDAGINAAGATYGGIEVESGKTYTIQMWAKWEFYLGAPDINFSLTAVMEGTYDDNTTAFSATILNEKIIDLNIPEGTYYPLVYQFTSTYTGNLAINYQAGISVFGLGTGTGKTITITGFMCYESQGWEQDSLPIYDPSYIHTDVTDFTSPVFKSLTDATEDQFDLNFTANTTNKLGFYIKSDVAKTITYVARSYEHSTKNYTDVTGTIDVTTTPQLVEITLASYASNDYGVMVGLRQASNEDVDLTLYGFYAYESTDSYEFVVGDTAFYDNLKDYVLGIDWKLGKNKYFEPLAFEGTLNLTLNNASKLFSPANQSSPLYGKMIQNLKAQVQVKDPDTGDWVTMWSGWTDSYNAVVGTSSSKKATIKCKQGLFRLREGAFSYEPQDDKRIDEVITTLVNNSGWRTTVTPLQWWLSNSKLLGVSTFLVDQDDVWSRLDQGVQTYELIGDGWNNKTKLETAIKDLLTAEDAVLWVTRDGHLELRNREAFAYFGSHDATIDVGTLTSASYSYGEDLINEVEVFVTPKEEEQSTIVWQTKKPIYAPRSSTSEPTLLTFEKEEGSERTVTNLQLAQSDMTVVVKSTERKRRNKTVEPPREITNSKILDNIVITTVDDGNGRYFLKVENKNKKDYWVDIAITGDYIKGGEGISYLYKDTDAISTYDALHKVSIESKIITEELQARGLADLRLLRNAYPSGEFTSITIISENATLTSQILDLTLGSFISLSEAQTGETNKIHVVIGESVKISNGLLYMSYSLARLPDQTFMKFGDDITEDSVYFI